MGYLYRHIRLDKNEVFYIGIGGFDVSEKMGSYRRAFSKCRRNNFWKSIIKKTKYVVEIIIDELDWISACSKEKEFIKLYGRMDQGLGTLVNFTDGGDGSFGLIKSEKTLEKISNSLKGRTLSEDTKNKIRIANFGKVTPENVKEKISQSSKGNQNNLGKKHTIDTKKKISKSKLGSTPWNKNGENLYNDEMKFNMGNGRRGKVSPFKGKKHTEESKEKNRLSHLGKIPKRDDYSCSNETKIKIAEKLLLGKKILIDGQIYNSYAEAEKSLGIHNKTIRYRVHSDSEKFKNYQLIDV